ncbi:MAG: hypothetical protein FWG38_01350, partial [Defluviitaleaceae bacterium]|nr:hypothetical protein [Defluviitaleaceae bacterium]
MRKNVSGMTKALAMFIAFVLVFNMPAMAMTAEMPAEVPIGESVAEEYAAYAQDVDDEAETSAPDEAVADAYTPDLTAEVEDVAASYVSFAPFADYVEEVSDWDTLRALIDPLVSGDTLTAVIMGDIVVSTATNQTAITIEEGVAVTLFSNPDENDGSDDWMFEITQDTEYNRHFYVLGELNVTDLILCGEYMWQGTVDSEGNTDWGGNGGIWLNAPGAVFNLGEGGAVRHSYATTGGGVQID